MISGINFNTTVMRIASFYDQNKSFLNDSLIKIASGKAVRKPSDSTGDYFKAQSLNTENKGYRAIQQQLGEAIAMNEVSIEAGTQVFELLTNMNELVNLYWADSTDPDDQAALQEEFSNNAEQISRIISNTIYDDQQLIQDTGASQLVSIFLNPNDSSQTFDISYDSGDIVDTAALAALNIGAPDYATVKNAVETELSKAGSYMAKTSAYSRGLWAQHNMISSKITTNTDFETTITSVDNAAELSSVIKRQVAQDSSLAMIAQANLMHRNVLMLYGLSPA